MKKFRFRLKSLEELRSAEVDAARQAMLAAQEELRRAEQRLVTLRESIEKSYGEIARMRSERADAAMVLSIEAYCSLLRQQEQRQQMEVQRLSRRFSELRDELAERHKDKRVLEKYRERLKEEHGLQMALHMQNELDETASKVHLRAG
jgi:flagellar export protein FliJ